MPVRKKILFLCTGNSCRSQMAEGLARTLKGNIFEVWSAGTAPKGIDPRAIDVMREIGIDISTHRSKHIDELAGISFDYVITLCGGARESCPVYPGAAMTAHRGFDDPPALAALAKTPDEALSHYRRVRDEIRAFIETLPESIVDSATTKKFTII